ncbi:hypothetical protein CTEN210_12614 [Chaetoceros tenuissimus]|uniref:Kinesin light chain n=3 Tax=Chaetoceros tenuissimus TaxID=426638 RepID=A0AAD3D1Z7_9STRA|nr:hypothetical protein CTEN210_12614 [Chaetoceros tenuissimus]
MTTKPVKQQEEPTAISEEIRRHDRTNEHDVSRILSAASASGTRMMTNREQVCVVEEGRVEFVVTQNTIKQNKSHFTDLTADGILIVIELISTAYSRNRKDIFDEGFHEYRFKLAATHDRSIPNESYFSQIVKSINIYNAGIQSMDKELYQHAVTSFQEAMELLNHVEEHEGAAEQYNKLKLLLSCMYSLNLGHSLLCIDRKDDSINSYKQVIKWSKKIALTCLNSSVTSVEPHAERQEGPNSVEYHISRTFAASMNCIAAVYIRDHISSTTTSNDTSPISKETTEKLSQSTKFLLSVASSVCELLLDNTPTSSIYSSNVPFQSSLLLQLATIRNNLGRIHFRNGQYDDTLAIYSLALNQRQQVLPNGHFDLAAIYFNVGQVHQAKGDLLESSHYYEMFFDCVRSSTPLHFPDDAMAHVIFAYTEVCMTLQFYEKAESILKLSIKDHISAAQSRDGFLNNHCIYLLEKLAGLYTKQSKMDIASECYQTSISLLREQLEKISSSPSSSRTFDDHDISVEDQTRLLLLSVLERYSYLSVQFDELGYFDDTIEILSLVLETKRDRLCFIDGHHSITSTLNKLGIAHFNSGNLYSALQAFQECLEIYEASTEVFEAPMLSVLYNIATIYNAFGDYDQALGTYTRVLAQEMKCLQDYTPRTVAVSDDTASSSTSRVRPIDAVNTLFKIFRVYKKKANAEMFQDGLKYLLQAISLCSKYKDEIPLEQYLQVHFALGDEYFLQGNITKAISIYKIPFSTFVLSTEHFDGFLEHINDLYEYRNSTKDILLKTAANAA